MKKFRFMLGILICAFVLAACGSKEVAVDEEFNGMKKQDLQIQSENTFNNVFVLSDDALQDYSTVQDAATVEMLESWKSIKEKVGNRVGFEKFEVSESGDTVTTVLTEEFENKNVTLTITYDSSRTVTSAKMDTVNSTNDFIGNLVENKIMYVVVLVVVLFLLLWILKANGIILKSQSSTNDNLGNVDNAIERSALSRVSEENLVDDLELVAVITAAIEAASGTSSDGFVVRTIKRRNSKWQKA